MKIGFYVLYLKFNKVFPVIIMKPNHYFKKSYSFLLFRQVFNGFDVTKRVDYPETKVLLLFVFDNEVLSTSSVYKLTYG